MTIKQQLKNFLPGSVLAISLFGLGSNAFGLATVTLTQGPYSYGIGGEFTATPNADALSALGTPNLTPNLAYYVNGVTRNGNSFQTFCLEYQEHFSPGTPYEYGVGPAALRGGTATSDPISVGTAWLYQQFADGILANYFGGLYAGNRNGAAGALQQTFWWLEDELWNGGVASQPANIFVTQVIAQFGSVANAKLTTYAGLSAASFGVGVLNMGTPGRDLPYPNQDQLIRIGSVPDGGTTVMLMGAGLCGLFVMRRKLA